MKLLTISGLDGSGKSTQIQILKSYLENQGKKVFYFHAIQFSIANKFLNSPRCHPEQGRGISSKNNGIATVTTLPRNDKQKSVSQAGWLKIQLRKIALRIDLWRFKLLRNKLRNNGYDYILSDRYFYDTIINIEYLQNNSLPLEKGESKRDLKNNSDIKSPPAPSPRFGEAGLFQRGIIKPDTAIYLDTDPENIMSRERVPDQGLEYLQKKKELYDQSAEIFGMKIIDGNKNKEEIFTELKNLCQA